MDLSHAGALLFWRIEIHKHTGINFRFQTTSASLLEGPALSFSSNGTLGACCDLLASGASTGVVPRTWSIEPVGILR